MQAREELAQAIEYLGVNCGCKRRLASLYRGNNNPPAIDALAMAPDEPALRDLAESFRPLLEQLQAAPALADLDAFLAAGAPAAPAAVVPSVGAEVASQRD